MYCTKFLEEEIGFWQTIEDRVGAGAVWLGGVGPCGSRIRGMVKAAHRARFVLYPCQAPLPIKR